VPGSHNTRDVYRYVAGARASLTCWAVSGNLTPISSMAKPSRMNS
jgi:hypothetical protein